MKRDFAVRIFHNTTNKIGFLFWAELFRLCGLFVGEGLLSDRVGEEDQVKKRKQEEDDQCFQFFMMIGNREEAQKYKEVLPWEKLVFTESLYKSDLPQKAAVRWPDDEWMQQKLLNEVAGLIDDVSDGLTEAMKASGIGTEDMEEFRYDLKRLAEIYVRNELLLSSMNLQFYHYKTELLDEIEERYYHVYQEIEGLKPASPTMVYALLFCGYKANEAVQIKGFPRRVDQNLLVKRCMDLYEENPDFVNAKVLLGLIYSSATEDAAEAIMAFGDAVKKLGNACYCSHIYYWIGNRYEAKGKIEDAERNYRNAYGRKAKYRNIYKLGRLAEKWEHFEEACERYEELLARLAPRVKSCFADPLELEYYIKTSERLGSLYEKHRGEYFRAAEMYEKGVCAYKTSLQAAKASKDFFACFYGGMWTRYRKITNDRTHIEVMYKKLLGIYSKLRDAKKVEEYGKLLRPDPVVHLT